MTNHPVNVVAYASMVETLDHSVDNIQLWKSQSDDVVRMLGILFA